MILKTTFAIFGLFIPVLPVPALACACCAVENSWNEQEISRGNYVDQTVRKLQFNNPIFEDPPAFDEAYSASSAIFKNRQLKFTGPSFEAVFAMTGNSRYTRRDISFVIGKNQTVAEPVIFHELLIPGKLTLTTPGRFGESHAALLILQGAGNNCFEPQTLTRWILKPQTVQSPSSNSSPVLTGSGELAAPSLTIQHKE